MNYIALIFISLTMTCVSFYYQQKEKRNFNKAQETSLTLQKNLTVLEDDGDFLIQNAEKLQFLELKGWFNPHSRLIAAEKIKNAALSLNKVSFIFEPETLEEHNNGYAFKVSRIILETSAVLDTLIYDFILNILKNFPGILILRKLSLSRHETLTASRLSDFRHHKQPDFMRGEIIFEWVSMGEKNNEN